ncbi:MAG: 3-phenylpropionate MFS transporter [Bacilli bacterium]
MEQRWMSQRFFLFFFTWGVFLPYWTVWLTDHGMSVQQAGTIISIGLIVRGISQLFAFPSMSAVASVMQLQFWLPLLSFIALLLFPLAESFSYYVFVMIIFSIFYPAMLPLNETSASLLNQLPQFNYGKSRQWGSLGFTVALMITGVLMGMFGSKMIVIIIGISLFALSLHARLQAPQLFHTKGKSASMEAWPKLWRNKEFVLVLLVVTLIQGSHAIYNTFAAPYAITLGAPEEWVGFLLTVAVIAEIICFYFAQKVFGKMSIRTLLLIGAVAGIVRWSLSALLPELFVFAVSQVLHAITFALTHIAYMWYTSKKLDASLLASAQGMYAAFGMSFAAGFITLFTSGLYEQSASAAYGVMSGIAAFAFIIAYFFLKNEHKK